MVQLLSGEAIDAPVQLGGVGRRRHSNVAASLGYAATMGVVVVTNNMLKWRQVPLPLRFSRHVILDSNKQPFGMSLGETCQLASRSDYIWILY